MRDWDRRTPGVQTLLIGEGASRPASGAAAAAGAMPPRTPRNRAPVGKTRGGGLLVGGSSGDGAPGPGSATRREGTREGAREAVREGAREAVREGGSTAAKGGAATAGHGGYQKAPSLLPVPPVPAGEDWGEGWAEDAERWDAEGGEMGVGSLASNSVGSSAVWTRNSSNTTQASNLSWVPSRELPLSSALDPRSPNAGHSQRGAGSRRRSLPMQCSPYEPMDENPSFSHMLPDAAAAAVSAVAEDMMYGNYDEDFRLTGTIR